jgi:hypothetical protein
MNGKFSPVIEEVDLLAAELNELEHVGPHFVVFHRFHMEGADCLPGEEIAKISLIHRGREFRVRASLASRLLFDYLAHRRRLPQSAKQIQAGITTDAFYASHGANAKSGKKQTRRFSHVSIKEYVKRIRRSLVEAFLEAELELDPKKVLISESTESNQVNYRLRISVEWIHVD